MDAAGYELGEAAVSARLLVSARLREIAMRCRDADDVTVYLRRRQITGQLADPCRCPLIVWLHQSTGLDCLRVTTDSVWILDGDEHVASVPLPRVLRAWELAFDHGDYPQLITR